MGVPPCPVASLEAARMQQEALASSSSARAVLLVSLLGCEVGGGLQMGPILTALPASQEGPARGRPPGSPQVEAMLRELGQLWEDLQRKHQENGVVLQEIDKVHGGRAGVGTGHAPMAAACWGSPSEAATCGAWSCNTGTDVSGWPCSLHPSPAVLPVPQVPTVRWQHGFCLLWVAQSQADGFPALPEGTEAGGGAGPG